MNKKVTMSALVLTGALAVAGAGVMGVRSVSAQTADNMMWVGNPHDSLVQKLAEKFNLNKDEVQAVFTAHHQEHQAQMAAKLTERLDQLVSDGELTTEQKQLILDKRAELLAERQTNFEQFKDKTPEERKELMQQHHQELQTWANDNDINIKYVMGGFGMKGPGHVMMVQP